MTSVTNYPLLIEFVPGTRISREPEVVSKLPILQNGPPGTSVVFGDGAQVPLPTDQIVFAEDGRGAARVGFGGMTFEGMEGGQLVFFRVRDLQPEQLLSPQRGRRMTLGPRIGWPSARPCLPRRTWHIPRGFPSAQPGGVANRAADQSPQAPSDRGDA